MARKASGTSRLVAAAGGDGTINAVASGLAGTGCCLGVLPIGSGNDIARGLNIPRKLGRSVSLLADGYRMLYSGASQSVQPASVSIRKMDTGVARLLRNTDQNGGENPDGSREMAAHADCFFMNTLGFGFDGTVALNASRMPPAVGRWKYLISVLKSLFTYRASRMTVTTDGESWSGLCLMATVANGPVEGGGIRIAPDADPTDGLFHLVLIRDTGVLARIPLLLRILLYGASESQHVRFKTCRNVTVVSDRPLVVHFDGEVPVSADIETEEVSGIDASKDDREGIGYEDARVGLGVSDGFFWGVEAVNQPGRLIVLAGDMSQRRS
jgi:diacylglycerol kinase (ATP)